MTDNRFHIHGYPSIFNFGHKALDELFSDPVVIQEKIDGSQFSFGIYDGELACRSKGRDLIVDAPEKMFLPAVESIKSVADQLCPGWTYRCEFLAKPKHNSLTYHRTPTNFLVLYDIDEGNQCYLPHSEVERFAEELGFDCVPKYYEGVMDFSPQLLDEFLVRRPLLGGDIIEGIVIKNYSKFGPDKKVLMGKWVSARFKEIHKHEWKISNPGRKDVVQHIIDTYRTEARWEKAVQHLRERGELAGDVTDIGKLIKEARSDLDRECRAEIAEILAKHFMQDILRATVSGLPEWYKQKVVTEQENRIGSQT